MNIIITGASKGIGLAIAQAFNTSGNRLLLCARNSEQLEATANTLRNAAGSGEILTHAADLAIKEQAIAFGNWCLQQGTPHVLVNNAGQYVPGNVTDEAEGQLEKMIAVNLYSAYYLTRTVLPAMQQQKKRAYFQFVFRSLVTGLRRRRFVQR